MNSYNKPWLRYFIVILTGLFLSFPVAPDLLAAEIVLGAATSLTFIEGRESLDAVELAVEEINAAGGVRVGPKFHTLRVAPVDLQGALPGVPVSAALNRLERLIVEERVHAIVVGPFRSEVLLAGMDLIADHKVPLLGAIAMSPASEAKILKNPAYKYIFRTCLNAQYLVDYLINAMKYLKSKYGFDRVYIVNQDVAWARTTASRMARLYFNRSGWTILGQDNYATRVTDFSASLSRAETKGAQVILPIFDMPESGRLVEQWYLRKGRALMCGFISPMVGPGAWKSFQGKIEGALNVIFELGNIPSARWQQSLAFQQAYKAKFGRAIQAGHGPAPAYESVYILADAIEKAGSLDPDAIVAALETTDRTGVMGRVRFHQGHQVIFGNDPQQDALACIFQWQKNGQRKIVYPLSVADGDIVMPAAH
ncbi:MAG: ABC transporter substrate-binding protein [Desulfobacterales bacterium]|nr:ABC transporter substrate-binding protein [Desulfobacterales bacterium]